MPSPFPGMDPYLESPTHWSDFHPTFIQAWREIIADRLPSDYFARIGEDVVLIAPELPVRQSRVPDVVISRDPIQAGTGATALIGGVRVEPTTLANIEYLDPHTETFIEILRFPDQQVVAVLELLSPTNKYGDGRGFYFEKRQQLLRQKVHIVELDLLRAGRRLELDRPLPAGDYYAFVSRSERRPLCDVYPWTVREPLPLLPIPLLAPDADIEIDLGEAFRTAYQRGRYHRLIRYDQVPPAPSFAGDDGEWVVRTATHAIR
ncbi:MAG TPA: DUF4058 family protein [Tepidisphaeraceae bacterium]|nr:DUF4058 family protein [Tepidisphaeraceae bacterium]